MTFDVRPPPRKRSKLAGAALTLALFAALVTAYSAILIRARSVEASAGLQAFVAGLGLAVLATLVGIAALAAVWRTGVRGGVRAMFAIALSAAVLGGPAYVAGKGFGAPFATEASTDLADPPRFDRAARDRRPGDLGVPASPLSPPQSEQRQAGSADLAPLRLSLPPEEVANLAIGLVEERGWRLLGPTAFVRGGPPTGRIEAVARSAMLGLESDVSIRVRDDAGGSRVDVRSAARVGPTDFGANAALIRSFLADLASAADAAP